MKKLSIILTIFSLVFLACSFTVKEPENLIENYVLETKMGAQEVNIISHRAIVKTSLDFDQHIFKNQSIKVLDSMEVNHSMYWYLYAEKTTEDFLKYLKSINGILQVEPDCLVWQVQPVKTQVANIQAPFITRNTINISDKLNDSAILGACEYPLVKTQAIEAYNEYKAEKTVFVGIIDSGVNWGHEDFGGNNSSNVIKLAKTAFVSGLFSDKLNPNKTFTEIPSYQNTDGVGHGTHCAGIIGAIPNNEVGIAGSAFNKQLEIFSYQVFAQREFLLPSGSGSTWAVYGALLQFVKDVKEAKEAKDAEDIKNGKTPEKQETIPVNMSLGGFATEGLATEAIYTAVSNGVLPVVAMGNESRNITSYPACMPGVLAVGATTASDKLASFSSGGNWISICAPGENILSLSNEGTDKYVFMSGTSMATPFVTGAIAYLIANGGQNLTPLQMRAVLEETADKIDGAGEFSQKYGYGRINVFNAIQLIKGETVNGKKLSTVKDKYSEVEVTIKTGAEPKQIYIYEANTSGTEKKILASISSYKKEGEAFATAKIKLPYLTGNGRAPTIEIWVDGTSKILDTNTDNEESF